MAEQLPNPAELRTQARDHREKALQATDPTTRKMHVTVAEEFEKLAEAVEAERGADPRKRPAQR
jgi:hypothetical protein